MNLHNICNHSNLKRIDDNFVGCLDCKETFVNHKVVPLNKTPKDFVKENTVANRNFDRNFTNVIKSKNNTKPIYEFYTDRTGLNNIVVDRRVLFNSNPPKYSVKLNNREHYLTDAQIIKLLKDARVARVAKFNN